MNVWSVLLIIAVVSVFLAILIHKIAKWRGKTETVSVFLLPFGLLLTPTSLVLGTYRDNLAIQLAAIGAFVVLIGLCFIRLSKGGK